VADEIRMTEEDTVAPGASQLEDVLELSLLTAGPADLPVEDHGLDERYPLQYRRCTPDRSHRPVRT
jgi:hypothetical protein